ncbi:MAG: hypothetical protein EBX40_00090 [Gammaproteobacteria bacterium]|nr:hypothetical protein [Gammaproteobacteria bacterium]
MTNKQRIVDLITDADILARNEYGHTDGWHWTTELGLVPLATFAPAIKALEAEGVINVYRDKDARQSWGCMVQLKGAC